MTKSYLQEELNQILLSKRLDEFYLAIIENRQELLTDEEYDELTKRNKNIYGDNDVDDESIVHAYENAHINQEESKDLTSAFFTEVKGKSYTLKKIKMYYKQNDNT